MKKNKIINMSIFLLSIISLIISLKLFWNMGIYVDEFNTSADEQSVFKQNRLPDQLSLSGVNNK